MSVSDNEEPQNNVVSSRTVNIVVALALMAIAAVVMISCYRLGAGWAKDVGPDSGYFPFYVALFMFIACGATAAQNIFARRADGDSFIAYGEMKMMLQVLIPMSIFVVLAIYIGIYIATFLFIAFFMTWHGRYPIYKTALVAVIVPIIFFVIFEIWFLVPLPKGPLEHWLGY